MRLDSPSNRDASLRQIVDAISDLQTATPQESASIQYGRTSVVNGAGVVAAAIGYANGRSGLLIPRGGQLVTVQEWVNQTIAEAGEYNDRRITDLEGRAGRVEGRTTGLEGRASSLEGRMSTNEGSLTYAGNRITDVEGRVGRLEPRMAAAEGDVASLQQAVQAARAAADAAQSTANGRVTQAQLQTVSNAIAAIVQNIAALINRSNAHQSDLESLGKQTRPPLVQG